MGCTEWHVTGERKAVARLLDPRCPASKPLPKGVRALAAGYVWPAAYYGFLIVGPIVLLGLADMLQTKRAILRNFPFIGHARYFFEEIRPEIQQYFVESNTDGKPFAREERAVIYQRAKGARDTLPFGTQRDVYAEGYEWINHSMAPVVPEVMNPRIQIGVETCEKFYSASILNISALSFGALSGNAIEPLNIGAREGGFAHNTGEGSISPHHLMGGDLIWQIGTGYFGCRTKAGQFDPERFSENATEDVVSPPAHTAFSTPIGLLEFVVQLRKWSGGKPVGFKLCVGKRREFLAVCKAMIETGVHPDYIAIDGGEG